MAIVSFDDSDIKKIEFTWTSPFGAQKLTDIVEVMGPEQVGDDIDSKKVRAKNLVMSSDGGRLVVFGMPPFLKEGLECDVINCHTSAIIQIKSILLFNTSYFIGSSHTPVIAQSKLIIF